MTCWGVTVGLITRVTIIFRTSRQVGISCTKYMDVICPIFFSSFMARASLSVRVQDGIPFSTSTRFVTIAINSENLSIRRPV